MDNRQQMDNRSGDRMGGWISSAHKAAVSIGIAAGIAWPFAALSQPNESTASENKSGNESEQTTDADAVTLDPMTVYGETIFRNRTKDINPVLSYESEYFQRFEPVSVGQMLRRLPGVVFTSDIGEFQAPKLRGLPAGYTQVLVNGEPLPGSSANRQPLVDRIPLALVERIEIVRSPSASMPAAGIAGTINIILKEPVEFDGLYLTVGGAYVDAKEHLRDATESDTTGRVSIRYGGDLGPMNYLISATYQQRYNPKLQDTSIFEPTESSESGSGDFQLSEFVSQADTRESEDLSLHFSSNIDGGKERYSVDAFFVRTDRIEQENELVFEVGEGGFNGPFSDDFRDEEVNVDVGELRARAQPVEQELQTEDIEQTQWGISLGTKRPMGTWLSMEIDLGVRHFSEERRNDETEIEFKPDTGAIAEKETARQEQDIEDTQYSLEVELSQILAPRRQLDYGVSARLAVRETKFRVFEGGEAEVDQRFEIEEQIFAAYITHTFEVTNKLTLEHGIRIAQTTVQTESSGIGSSSDTYTHIIPTLAYRYNLSPSSRLRFAVARTIRRPAFNKLQPFVITEEPGEKEAITGNIGLEPQTAWGIDFGYEINFASGKGIAGINFFYRSIDNVIHLVATGKTVTRGGDTFDLFQYRNVGEGTVYGVEFDLSTPLTMIGLANTAVFANATLIESKLDAPLTDGERDFSGTPEYVVNLGIQQGFGRGWTAGASFQDVGDSTVIEAAEITVLEYEPFLQVFVEKRFFGEDLTLRLVGTNLLDRAKIEHTRNFESIEARLAGEVESRALEIEQRGPLIRLVARYRF